MFLRCLPKKRGDYHTNRAIEGELKCFHLDFDRLPFPYESHIFVLDLCLHLDRMVLRYDDQQLLGRCHNPPDGMHRQLLHAWRLTVSHPRTGERLYRTGDLGRYRPGGEPPVEVVSSRNVELRAWRKGELEEVLRAAGAGQGGFDRGQIEHEDVGELRVGGGGRAEEPLLLRVPLDEVHTIAAEGGKADIAKPMHGLGSGVFEIALAFKGDAYRVVYGIQLGADVWVINAFQKKSTRGIGTPKRETDLVKDRLKRLKEMLR